MIWPAAERTSDATGNAGWRVDTAGRNPGEAGEHLRNLRHIHLAGRTYCGSCTSIFQTDQISEVAKSAGTVAAHSEIAQAFRSQSARRHTAAMSAWDRFSLLDWLNAECYMQKILPMLANVTTSAISTALGVSWVYASHIQAGAKRPHTRH